MHDKHKKPSDSDTRITELMIPAYANFGGKIHGGILLSLMDKVAYACATRHAETYCVTVSVENVDFLAPVEVGDLVSMIARVNYTGTSSMVVGIRVEAENVANKTLKHTNTSYFTMVAKGEDGKPAPVPGLLLTHPNDLRRYAQALMRKELKQQRKDIMSERIKAYNVGEEIRRLENHNCIVRIEG
ncbi:MAG: acyl-CoA thioesterase [Pseudomonadota bacterium]